MSISISTSPTEEAETVRHLLRTNLFEVFGQRDEIARTTTIADIFHHTVVWHEPTQTLCGKEEVNQRAAEILVSAPGCAFSEDGDAIVSQNLGVLNWSFGPPDNPNLLKGTDIIVVEGGKIKVLWTAINKAP